MADNPKILASLADELPTEKQPTMREHVQEIIERQMPTVEDRCREARARIAEVNKPTKAESFWLRSIPLQGYDADVLLSYIVDEYERLAAAALRAPTIAAEERCESCRKVLARGWKYDASGDVKLCPHCYAELRREGRMTQAQGLAAALATPSPTIAAPSPPQSNTLDLPPCPVCGETLVTRYSGPLPGCPQGISTAVCPTNPSHASQPPQASPSNEVTAEMVEAAAESMWLTIDDGYTADEVAAWAEVDDGTKAMLRIEARAAIEAALSARKPSPSNEVTAEMVDRAFGTAALILSSQSKRMPTDDALREMLHGAIEAALKARKPADDGAGQ